jgi:hypothetical protein
MSKWIETDTTGKYDAPERHDAGSRALSFVFWYCVFMLVLLVLFSKAVFQ